MTTKENFVFKDGIPTSYNFEHPSELLAILGLPVTIAKAVFSVPAQIIQLRVAYDTQATALVNAQVEYLKTQLAALQAKKALDSAKAPSGTTP